jgi:pimeloyl-ACP methyl ester carboxylesterase
MSRHFRSATIPVAVSFWVTMLVAGCVPGLAADPRFATNSGARPQGAATPKPPPSGPPPIAAPKNDLSWHDCTSRVFGDAAVPPAAGVQLDCANYDADLDPNGGTGTVSIGVVRARSNQTPHDAGPLVFTTGSDLPSSTQLPVWLSRSGADVLQSRPIVAVDRRGIGMSSPIDCRDRIDRQVMRDQTQFQTGDDPVANLSDVSNTATTNCTDALAPAGDSAYDDSHAASDIERLRNLWDVPALALAGVGNGAQVALSYAASRPDKVARLILDSPVALGINAEAAAEQQVKGQQASLDAFAAQCLAVNCALGPDPKAAVNSLLADARAGKGPGGASAAEVANAITVALGFPSGGRVNSTTSLANALAAARSGDTGQLNGLIAHADATQDTDGQFVNSCSDAVNRPTPDRVRELVVAWGKLYPQFGVVAALNMVRCLHWPSSQPPQPPKDLKVDALLLGVQNDPIVGVEGVAQTAAMVINANAASRRVMWQGIGHGASIYSPCAVPPLVGYVNTGKLPGTDTYCPA